MPSFSTTTAVVLVTAALAGGAAGAAIHATMTARVDVSCPAASPAAPVADADLRRFMSPPAPSTTGNPRY